MLHLLCSAVNHVAGRGKLVWRNYAETTNSELDRVYLVVYFEYFDLIVAPQLFCLTVGVLGGFCGTVA